MHVSYWATYGKARRFLDGEPQPRAEEDSIRIPWARMRMLVHLYVRDLQSYSDRVEEFGGELNKALFYTYGPGRTKQENVEALVNTIASLRDAIDGMQGQIVAESNRLGSRRS